MNIKLLSVIVPIYKSEKTVKKDLKDLYHVLENTPYNFELIAVIDGTSEDKSFERAKSLKLRKLKVYGYKMNRGKGQAVRYGMVKAKGDVIMFIDAGGDIDPDSLVMLLEHMKWYDADIIIGSKLHSASKVKRYPFKRKLYTYGYYLGVKLLFGLKVRDTQTGLKAYKRKVLEKTLDRMVIKRFAFDIELLAVSNKLGFTKIYDAPVIVDMGKASTIKNIFGKNGVWRFVIDTISVWYRMYVLNYYSDGRDRVKVFDKELKMYVNTGDLKNKRQVIIDFVNKLMSFLH